MKLRFKRDLSESAFSGQDAFYASGDKAVYKVQEQFLGDYVLIVTPYDEAFKLLPNSKVYEAESKGEAMDLAQSME
jgi:hypothetical protein